MLCDPPRSWSWGEHGERQGVNGTGSPPNGVTQITGWGVAQWAQCGASAANTRYQARNLRVYAYRGAQGWFTHGGGFDWCVDAAPTTAEDDDSRGDCAGSPGDWLMLAGERSIHWATNRQGWQSGTQCLVTVYEARKVGPGTIIANAGADYILGNTIWGAVVGRYVAVGTDWTTIGAASCSTALLRSSPPPGF